MKYASLIMISALLLTAACNTVEHAGGSLTDEERQYLAQRQLEKCMGDTQKTIDDVKADSAAAIMDFVRDNSWKYEYKKDSTVVDTTSISVWKVASPNLYLRLNINEDGQTYNKFIKIRLDDNNEMWTTVQTMKCSATLPPSVKTRTVSLGTTATTTTITDTRINGDEADTFVDGKTVYNFKTALPAYYGFLDRVRTKQTLDKDGKVTKTETFTYVLTKIASPTAQNTSVTSYSNRKYCMVIFKSPVAPATANTFDFPYTLKCEPDTATTVDANGDAVADFNINELTI